MRAPGVERPPPSSSTLLAKRRKLVHVPRTRPTAKRGNGNDDSSSTTASSLFAPGARILVQRAPVMCGLSLTSSSLFTKKFQRPLTKRRSYDKTADRALKSCSLGPRRRMDGMSKLMARAGKGLAYKLPKRGGRDGTDSETDSGDEKEEEKDMPFEPLRCWHSPHEGGEPRGLPPAIVTEMQADEYGVEEAVQVERPAPASAYAKQSAYVPPILCKWLRPHQREGLSFLYQCTMSLRSYDGAGCILADDMGLGKTLQSITLLYTLLKTSITADNAPSVKRCIIVCPCSLVKNWDNEITKWIANGGPGPSKGVPPPRVMALAELDRATIEKNLDAFCRTSLYPVLIVSYETLRTHVKRLTTYSESKCDLLICDEAHRLKNRDNLTTRALNTIPCRRRVLLTGTPMQNDLEEFYAMVDFCNPGILGTPEDFRKVYLFPILRGREPDATDRQRERMMDRQRQLSELVNNFILRRINTLNAEHLPPKLVQVVCCDLTDIQRNMYDFLVTRMEKANVLEGKQSNALGWIQLLMKLSNHPRLIADEDPSNGGGGSGGRKRGKIKYNENEGAMTESLNGVSRFLPDGGGCGGGGMMGRRNMNHGPVRPEFSGKMFVLYRLMTEMRKPYCRDKIVIVSNYTQTLDLIGQMCAESNWGFCRLDGSIGMKKRQKMCDDFNDPNSHLIAFLLSSKAGGCGLNLIGGNRLVLFDPDWNPAVDKQAAARCWRDGQKKRCFTYRFLATGTVEEKIFQRQLSKEGLQSVVDDKEQCNAIASKDLRNLFKLRTDTPSDTHDKLNCQRCKIIHENSEQEAKAKLPLQLRACRELLDKLCKNEDGAKFIEPLKPEEHEVTREEYEKAVKQPMDLSLIRKKLAASLSSSPPPSSSSAATKSNAFYTNISQLSRDVNRIWSNVLKVWSPGKHEVADGALRMQSWWMDEWTELVPKLMAMKAPQQNPDMSDDKENMGESSGEVGPSETSEESNAPNNNERSEDFQEQIGMPDEENMRNWSHHFSTETCDDPVMRTAMKGFDTVSFVFGLEVTWSLIQQRQQEEEERAAMEELHRLEQLDEQGEEEEPEGDGQDDAADAADVDAGPDQDDQCDEADEDSCGDDSSEDDEDTAESEPPPSNSKEVLSADASVDCDDDEHDDDAGEAWTISRIYTKEEIESSPSTLCVSYGCELVACSIWKSGAGEEWKCCLDCQEKEFGGWDSGFEPVDKPALMDCIRAKCSKLGSGLSADNGDGLPQDAPSMDGSEKEDGGDADVSGDASDGWSCPQCTYLNTPRKKKCSVCTCRKPSERKTEGKKRPIDEVE